MTQIGDGRGAYIDVEVEIGRDGGYRIVDEAEAGAALERVRQQRRGAEARAKELFVRLLSDKQRKTFTSDRFVEVKGESGRTYRIDCGGGYSGNVLWIKGRLVMGRFCAHPATYQGSSYVPLPRHDAFLGQLLLLSTDEKKFLEKAVYSGACHPSLLPGRRSLFRLLGFGS